MASALFSVVILVAVLIAAWFVVERFSPDPLLTKLCQLVIFVLAVGLVLFKLLPML